MLGDYVEVLCRVHLGRTLLYYGGAVALVAVLAVLAVLAVATMLLWVLPAPGEITRLRAEKATLEAAVTDLSARGGRIQLRNCGATGQKTRLCARVDPSAGTFGTDTERSMVLQGY